MDILIEGRSEQGSEPVKRIGGYILKFMIGGGVV